MIITHKHWQGNKRAGRPLLCTPTTNVLSFGGTYIKIGTIQRRLAWPLRKDDTQIREAFQIFYDLLASIPFSVALFRHHP